MHVFVHRLTLAKSNKTSIFINKCAVNYALKFNMGVQNSLVTTTWRYMKYITRSTGLVLCWRATSRLKNYNTVPCSRTAINKRAQAAKRSKISTHVVPKSSPPGMKNSPQKAHQWNFTGISWRIFPFWRRRFEEYFLDMLEKLPSVKN